MPILSFADTRILALADCKLWNQHEMAKFDVTMMFVRSTLLFSIPPKMMVPVFKHRQLSAVSDCQYQDCRHCKIVPICQYRYQYWPIPTVKGVWLSDSIGVTNWPYFRPESQWSNVKLKIVKFAIDWTVKHQRSGILYYIVASRSSNGCVLVY